uniref:Uncharacterized protein n=1 Tax=Arundo donax TaxID=35708 RepID=A0A0A9GAN1_ARUDO
MARAPPPPRRAPGGPTPPPSHCRPRAQGRPHPDSHGPHQRGRTLGRPLPVQPRGLPPGRARRGVPPREDRRGGGHHLQPPAAQSPRLGRRLRRGRHGWQGQGQAQPGVRAVPVDVPRGRVPGRAVGSVAEGDGGDGAGSEPQRGGADGAVRRGAQLLRGAVRLPGGGGSARVGGARARGAVDARGGDQEHRGVRRRGAVGAARAAGAVGAADGGGRLRARAPELLRAAAGAAGGAGPRLRRLQGARGEGLLLPVLAGPRALLRLRLARPPLQLTDRPAHPCRRAASAAASCSLPVFVRRRRRFAHSASGVRHLHLASCPVTLGSYLFFCLDHQSLEVVLLFVPCF